MVRIVFVCEIVRDLSPATLEAHRREYAQEVPREGVSGILVSQGHRICGLVEGPQAQVLSHVERIATDRRHLGLKVLREGSIERRRFTTWTYAPLPSDNGCTNIDQMAEEFAETISRRL